MAQPAVVDLARAPSPSASARVRVALVGNPNSGKTTLFNRLCGLRHKTSNFPGTTQEARIGHVRRDQAKPASKAEAGPALELIDLPGIYSLHLDQTEARMCRDVLGGRGSAGGGRAGQDAHSAATSDALRRPDAACVVIDAHNIPRGLALLAEVREMGLPTVIAITMVDSAVRRGIHAEESVLGELVDSPAIAVSARTGLGIDQLVAALQRVRGSAGGAGSAAQSIPSDPDERDRWIDSVCERIRLRRDASGRGDAITGRLDRVLTHPVLGLVVFVAVMWGLFLAIFSLATHPMNWIDWLFATLGAGVSAVVPAGLVHDFLAGGVIAGVGATVIFLPQICLLFFLITLLEDTGYLARAAFLMDRLLRPFGLTGHAFVPLLSSHACALPGIMATRAVPDPQDRLATILVAPFMSCTARIPVYVLLTVLLFPGSPVRQTLAFVACYALGVVAGIFSALVARRTILRGRSRPMAMELPPYRAPSVRNALICAWDRGLVFLKKAGTIILLISVVLWWLGSFPRVQPPAEATQLRAQADALEVSDPASASSAEQLQARADEIEAIHAARSSFIGRLGSLAQPIFEPLGYDRQLTIGVLASFAAREVFVTTMAVVATGHDDAEDEGVRERLAGATRDDGSTPIFTPAASWSLLVYYVLAMQCLPTLALTAREAGHWKWAALQLAWMLGLAYVGALLAFRIAGG